MDPLTIEELLRARARSDPRRDAIRGLDGPRLDYSGLESLTGWGAGQLAALGLSPTSRIAVVLPNGPGPAVALLATMRAGIAAPLNPNLRGTEFRYHLEDLGAGAVIAGDLAQSDHETRLSER